eukprot:TRINITY_DN864_c0_g1_i1.p1 TRINITY_DN864_c0_g1~~TRINITY_DN864_c0_g1_i1.p1  ORF type:complete len:129 (-),score=15.51 TRINITY_DN864_c0_g1_i1:577-963(-)
MDISSYHHKYSLIEEISKTDINEVVVVFNNDEKNVEVLKILKNKPVDKLKDEATIATSLEHQNILTAKSECTLFTNEGQICKILTYKKVDMDLFDYIIDDEIELSKFQLYSIFFQMANAVHYLHENLM